MTRPGLAAADRGFLDGYEWFFSFSKKDYDSLAVSTIRPLGAAVCPLTNRNVPKAFGSTCDWSCALGCLRQLGCPGRHLRARRTSAAAVQKS